MILWLQFVFAVCITMQLAETSINDEYSKPLHAFALDREQGKALDPRVASRRRLAADADQAPLSWLMGSFFAYLYVGTPAQRVTVITDTGSHHTAFPCIGCACGKHMDAPYNPSLSSTAIISRCGGGKCFMQQSYSEGSSWHAYEVQDRVWVGEETVSTLPQVTQGLRGTLSTKFSLEGAREAVSANWSTLFKFGCQDKETGLFRTQEVDGIMGLSAHDNTLPFALYKAGVTTTKAFAMCMRTTGGVLTLGGVDASLHEEPARWAALLNKHTAGKRGDNGWFTVRLVDILMKPVDGPAKSIGVVSSKFSSGKGTIVDSGTTDTYLPSDITQKWNTLFAEMSGGMKYSNRMQEMSEADFSRLPTLVYRLEAWNGKGTVDIESPPSSYTETVVLPNGRVKRTHRVYTTEGVGAVLGSNFMTGYNTIFDIDAGKIGFARSKCMYSEHGAQPSPKIVRGDGTALDQGMIAPWEQSAYAKAVLDDKVSAQQGRVSVQVKGHSAAILSKSNFGLGSAEPGGHLPVLQYDFVQNGSFASYAQTILNKCGQAASELQSACSAKCSTIESKEAAYLATGQQTWGHRECVTSSPTGDAGKRHVQQQPCSYFCTSASEGRHMARGLAPQCLEEPWGECRADCTQTRSAVGAQTTTSDWAAIVWLKSILASFRTTYNNDVHNAADRAKNSTGTSCERHIETRLCRTHRCPSQTGDWSVAAEVHVRFVRNQWSNTHIADMIHALSLALHLPENFIHATKLKASPDEESGQELRGTVKLRIPNVHYRASTAKIAEQIAGAMRHADLPRLVSRLGSARGGAGSGEGYWLLPDTISFHGVSSTELRDAPQSTKVVTAEQAVSGIHGLSTSYLHPTTWSRVTYVRVFVACVLQVLAVGLFFVVRRVQEIRSEQPSKGFDAFIGTEQRRIGKTDSTDTPNSNGRRKRGRATMV